MEGMERMKNLSFYSGKRVFITGHSGFKGSWLSAILKKAGACVTGYSLMPPEEPSLFEMARVSDGMNSITGDIRDYGQLYAAVKEAQPEIVFHLAAQPIVRRSYYEPRLTFETNVMGTVNLLEAVRRTDCVRSLVNITTDKVYLNREIQSGYSEEDPLNGWDPYSNSKSCSDLATQSYRNSFFLKEGPAVSTARAGNVIGGGDFAKDRLIPDCVRAAERGETIILRNPDSIRPFQHVLEPLAAYLLIAEEQEKDRRYAGAYNAGPSEEDCVTAGKLADYFCEAWNREGGVQKVSWKHVPDGGPHEASYLKLDSSKIREVLGFTPRWNIREAVGKTVEFTLAGRKGMDIKELMLQQAEEYFDGAEIRRAE